MKNKDSYHDALGQGNTMVERMLCSSLFVNRVEKENKERSWVLQTFGKREVQLESILQWL
jgi:hypothetical protein